MNPLRTPPAGSTSPHARRAPRGRRAPRPLPSLGCCPPVPRPCRMRHRGSADVAADIATALVTAIRRPIDPAARSDRRLLTRSRSRCARFAASRRSRRSTQRSSTKSALSTYVQDQFRKDNPEELVDANERLLKGLGLLPADASLEDLYIDLLSSQVAGFYNPEDKQLYVVSRSGALGPTEKTTFAHEYTHALQDQNFDLSGIDLDATGRRGPGDRPPVARRGRRDPPHVALADQTTCPRRRFSSCSASRSIPKITGALEKMPPVLRESLLLPVHGGPDLHPGAAGERRMGRRRTPRSPAAGIDRADHPSREIRQRRGADRRRYPRRPRRQDGLRLDYRARRHSRRVPAQALAGRGRRSRGLGRTTEAAAGWGGDRIDHPRRSRRGIRDRHQVGVGHPRRRRRVRCEGASSVVGGLADPGDVLAPVDGTGVTVVIASSEDLVGRVENVLGLAG